ncbi:hypothetical protein [Streptodolium elevatio]|uniref:Uncharacterized protein n=1 Tax=Streptodolium elevatio TaxID=3157996 RepID=A0ABV3DBY1_9ACTN
MYVATINVPGYLPMDDEPAIFETPAEAWEYLAEERKRAEDEAVYSWDDVNQYEYTDTVAELAWLAAHPSEFGSRTADWPTDPDGTGCVHGDTPGRDTSYDLGLIYSVMRLES